MEGVKEKALSNAMKALTGIGCKFAILTPEGQVHGELEIAPEKRKAQSRFVDSGYREKVTAMQVGDVLQFESHNPATTDNFRSSIGSKAMRCFGMDSYITNIKREPGMPDIIEIIRVA